MVKTLVHQQNHHQKRSDIIIDLSDFLEDYKNKDLFFDGLEYLTAYSFDSTQIRGSAIGVFLPKKFDDVLDIVNFLRLNKCSYVFRGMGSGFSGGAVPKNAYIVSFERMNNVVDLDLKREIAFVEPGIINYELNEYLAEYNHFYSPDPASKKFCSIGGNISHNSGGLNSRREGLTSENILGLKVLMANGDLIETGVYSNENYMIQELVIGSEGTLGAILEVAVKIKPLYNTVSMLVYGDNLFDYIEKVLKKGLTPMTFEFIEKKILQLMKSRGFLNRYDFLGENDILLLKIAENEANDFEYFNRHIGVDFFVEDSKESSIWDIRRDISQNLYFLGEVKKNEDISLPIEKMEIFFDKIEFLRKDWNIYIFGHAGDGNLHLNLMLKMDYDAEIVEDVLNKIFTIVVELGGSISGEHGIGLAKQKYFSIEHSEFEIGLMKKIKYFFDKNGLLNNGKIWE